MAPAWYAKRSFACVSCGLLRRARSPDFAAGRESPNWPKHCSQPMQLLGYRSSQAVTRLEKPRRAEWLANGAPVVEGRGKRRWKPALSKTQLRDAYSLR